MVNWQVSGSTEGAVSRGAVFYSGVVAVLLASFLSGLSAAVTEKVLQVRPITKYRYEEKVVESRA